MAGSNYLEERRMSKLRTEAIASDIYKAINARFLDLTPRMDLKCYFLDDPSEKPKQIDVKKNTLDGIDFVPKDADALMRDLDAAVINGERAFEKGSTKPVDFQKHWAHSVSLMATKGIGYREPWRMVLTDRALRIADAHPSYLKGPEMDQRFSGYFGEAFKMNLKALHVGVGFGSKPENNMCNVHIDEMGIEMMDENGNVSVTPNVGYHLANELIVKSKIPGLPNWVKTNVNLHFLSADMGYNRIGASVDLYKSSRLKITVSASCALTSCDNIDYKGFVSFDRLKSLDFWKQFNPTINVTGSHDIFGGSSRKKGRR